MRTIAVAVLLTTLAWATPALAAGMGEDFAAAKAQVLEGNLEAAAPALQAVLAQATERGWDKLTAQELLQVAEAYRLLMGIAAQAALDKGGLADEETKTATGWAQAAKGAPPIKIVSHGEPIDIEEHLVPGKTNIVDFFSKFCPPCVRLGEILDPAVAASDDLFLLKVDINRPGVQGIDWDSPVAEQFKLRSIPYMRVYGPDGTLIAEGDAARDKVSELLARGDQ